MRDDKEIPKFDSYEEMAAFWDTHSLADYWEQTEPVDFDFAPRQLNQARARVKPFRVARTGLPGDRTPDCLRRTNHHWHSNRAIHEIAFAQNPTIPVHLAVIRTQHNHRVVHFTARFDCRENLTNLIVNQRHVTCVIRP